jgi:hypothetical protein
MTTRTTTPHEIDRVAWAINQRLNEIGVVPFQLYQHEAEKLAEAAIIALRTTDGETGDGGHGNG